MYTKPSVSTLGDALRIIETINPKPSNQSDSVQGANHTTTPAYDLDE